MVAGGGSGGVQGGGDTDSLGAAEAERMVAADETSAAEDATELGLGAEAPPDGFILPTLDDDDDDDGDNQPPVVEV